MTTPLVELCGVARRFGPEMPVRDVDLTLGRGELVSLMGPSGSGKSTLLHILALLDRPTTGSYTFDGESVGRLSERARCRLRATRVGLVFQSFHLLPRRTAFENVLVGGLYSGTDRRVLAARAERLLRDVGLEDRLDARPSTMSGGEQQRVAIARALVNGPDLLLADEPTGNLDSTASERILRIVEGCRDDRVTVLLVTHDPAVARRAERRLVLHDGVLVGDG